MQPHDEDGPGAATDDFRPGVEAADDTGMIAQQEFLHAVGDAETGDDVRGEQSGRSDVERE